MDPDPEETLDQFRWERDLYRRALCRLMREEVTFTEEELADIEKNGIDMDDVVKEIEKITDTSNGQ